MYFNIEPDRAEKKVWYYHAESKELNFKARLEVK